MVCANCHAGENLLQHWGGIVVAWATIMQEDNAMKTFIDRFFGDIDRIFDESWVVIWQLDDF
jgi:hypothetical protein